MSPASTTALAPLRRHRVPGVWCFVLLLCLAATERRLSEFHFNLRTAATGLESDDVLDGDEIRVRLIGLNDETPPTLTDADAVLIFAVAHPSRSLPASIALGSPAPRGPPAPRAAA